MPGLKSDVRRLFEQCDLTIIAISRLTGVARTTIQTWIKRENWTKNTKNHSGADINQTAGVNWQETLEQSVVLLFRLRKIARHHIESLEGDIEILGRDVSSTERERNVRALRNILKIIEEITAQEKQLGQTSNDGEKTQFNDKTRLELARRIEALRGKN